MQVLKREFDRYKLRIDCEDDLWALARICIKGRSIGMLGERRDQTTAGQEGGRAKSAERKKMWIKLAIESNEFHTFSDNLRVHGIIEEAKFDHGSHHTHIIEVRDEIEITDEGGFPSVDKDLIKQACAESGKAKVVILVVEADEVILFEVSSRGMREISTWTMRGGGKRGELKQSSKIASSFRSDVIHALTATLGDETPLILCGPGHARDALLNDLKAYGETRFMKSIATSMGGRSGANEVLREGLAGDLLNEYAISRETSLIEEAWLRLSTNGAVAYGKLPLQRAMDEGAIEKLLISADLLRDESEKIFG